MKKTLVLLLVLGGGLALGLADLHARRSHAQDSKPSEPEESQTCHLAHAKGGTVEVPFGDHEKMAELQGLDGKSHAKVTIEWPKNDEVLPEGKGLIKYTLEGYEIGKGEKGSFQHCHVILDDSPYEADYDHTTTLEKLNGGKPLAEGSHWLTIFPARNFHLSVKNEGACAQVVFHVKSKSGRVPAAGEPQLIYSRPKGAYDSAKGEAKQLLLDFYLINWKFAPGSFIDCKIADASGNVVESHKIEEWWPKLILKDAKPGKYKITLQLTGNSGGDAWPYRAHSREITIK